jgi:hypothetical protein
MNKERGMKCPNEFCKKYFYDGASCGLCIIKHNNKAIKNKKEETNE